MYDQQMDEFAARDNPADKSERTILFEIASSLRDIVEELKQQNAYGAIAAKINELTLGQLQAQMGGGIVKPMIIPGGKQH